VRVAANTVTVSTVHSTRLSALNGMYRTSDRRAGTLAHPAK